MKRKTPPRNNIGTALRNLRLSKDLPQESFGTISSRTYISSVERGIRHPTLSKLDEIATKMGVHPLTLLTLAYVDGSKAHSLFRIQEQVVQELQEYGHWQKSTAPK